MEEKDKHFMDAIIRVEEYFTTSLINNADKPTGDDP